MMSIPLILTRKNRQTKMKKLKMLLDEKDIEIAILRDIIKKEKPLLTAKIKMIGYRSFPILYRLKAKKISEGRPAPFNINNQTSFLQSLFPSLNAIHYKITTIISG